MAIERKHLVLFLQHRENFSTSIFYCHLARAIWNTIFITFGIKPHLNVSTLFGLKGLLNKPKIQNLVGAAAIFWSLWLFRNDMVTTRKVINSSWSRYLKGKRGGCDDWLQALWK